MTVKDFLAIKDEGEILKLKAIKDAIKGRNYIGDYKSKKFIDFSYAKVQELKEYYKDGNLIYLVSATCNIGHAKLLKRPYEDFLYYLKFIEEQFEIIFKLESKLNERSEDEELEQMNLEDCGDDYTQLGKLGIVNIIDSLANGDILKWDEIQKRPWKEIFTILLRQKLTARIQRKIAKMKKPKG